MDEAERIPMSLARKIAWSAAGGIALLIVIGLTLPSTPHVERQIHIQAPPATVFALVNDFRQIKKLTLAVDVMIQILN